MNNINTWMWCIAPVLWSVNCHPLLRSRVNGLTIWKKIHLKFNKANTYTCNIWGLGTISNDHPTAHRSLKYWCRILKLSESHPVRNAYDMLLELDGIGFTDWCPRIRFVFEQIGLEQIWESQNIGDTNKLMLLFEESIVRIFTQ